MKNYMKLFAIALLAVAFSACSKEGPNQPVDDNYGSESLYMVEWSGEVEADYTEGDMMKPYEMLWNGSSEVMKGKGMRGDGNDRSNDGGCWGPNKKMDKYDFRGFFRSIQLTPDQRAAIQTYMEAFRDCQREAFAALRASELEILQNANTQRLDIRAKLAAGEIDTATARTMLHELAVDTREAIRDNPLRAQTLESIKDCYETLFDNIRSQLNERQLAKFEKFIEKLKDKLRL